ncbi:Chlorophyllase-1 [Forsythia ovata]|uniref:Chlorophyllase-1 n=1 Tax=Forsythia ovata TaxID=205694 RepID=A0ABD1X5G9_9LAMI
MAALLESKNALATSTISVFDQGSVKVKQCTIKTSHPSSPPTELFIVAPVVENTYPVLLFCHGFCIDHTLYSQLLEHISSHGYIVVAPQLYRFMFDSVKDEIERAAKVSDWLSMGLPQVLKVNVKPDLSKLALCGHSRGGKAAFALALGHAPTSVKFSAILGIDPVDGSSPSSRLEPNILTFVPRSFNLEIPVGIIGTGLGNKSKNIIIPPSSPDGVNHAEFFNESKPPCCYFLAKDYGHCDMLDESKFNLASWVCKSGEGSKEDMRRGVGGIVVAFLNAYLGDESGDLKEILDKPSTAPILLDPVVFVKE